MIYLEFNDFGQLYHDLTRFPIKHEKEFGNFGNDYFEVGQSQYINNLIIRVLWQNLKLMAVPLYANSKLTSRRLSAVHFVYI